MNTQQSDNQCDILEVLACVACASNVDCHSDMEHPTVIFTVDGNGVFLEQGI